MKINVVCYANYCRSPVAAILLQKYLSKDYIVSSSGLNPFTSFSMDPRSLSYLEKNYNLPIVHIPKKIDEYLVEDSDLVLALDLDILKNLKHDFKKFKDKIKLISFIDDNRSVPDPYLFKEINDYNNCMTHIDLLCKKLSFFLIEEN